MSSFSRLIPACLAAFIILSVSTEAKDKASPSWEQGFENPPPGARPLTWWHWMNGNISKEGIRADLEDMKRAGLAGAQIFNIKTREALGPVPFGSKEWEDCVKYAMSTAKELGLELEITNGPGWSNSGGPWVTPEQSMKKVVWTETTVKGPAKLQKALPQPEAVKDFYRDIRVFAVPADPASEKVDPVIEEGEPAVWAEERKDIKWKKPWTYTYTFAEPTEQSNFLVTLEPVPGTKSLRLFGRVEVSMDGTTFKPVHEFDFWGRTPWLPVAISFPRSTGKIFRLVADIAVYDGKPVKVAVDLSNNYRTENFNSKSVTSTIRDVTLKELPSSDAAGAIKPEQILELTTQMKPDGTLEWDVPAGRWTILRMGYTTTGKMNHPAPAEGTGLEVDKMNKAALHKFLNDSLGSFLKQKGLTGILLDSWEVGRQNWTRELEVEFLKLRGYDMKPFLPALTGRVVGSPAETEAFLMDFRRTISELIGSQYFRGMREFSHQHDLKFYGEPYDGYCFNEFQCGPEVEVLMTEFWAHDDLGRRVIEMASLAHILGRQVLAGEAFTASSELGRWIATPALIKRAGDMAFAQGLNRTILHSYVHQPRSDLWPGFSMLFYGTNFGRLNPWWREARPWVDYLSRSQFLLQQGRNEADFLFLQSGDMDYMINNVFPEVPDGFAMDRVGPLQLEKLSARDGKVMLENGAAYRAIVVGKNWVASTGLLTHLESLVKGGVTLIGNPPSAPDRLSDQKDLSAWQTIVARLWPDAKPRGSHDLTAFVKEKGWPADCLFTPASGGADISWNHHVAGGSDIYYIANSTKKPVTGRLELRASGRQPELWNAVTGEKTIIPFYQSSKDGTAINLALNLNEALFVVLRNPLPKSWTTEVSGSDGQAPLSSLAVKDGALWVEKSGAYQTMANDGTKKQTEVKVPASLAIAGPWNVSFKPPTREGFEKTFDDLSLWNTSSSEDVKYFSGTGTYKKEVAVPEGALGQNVRAILNLGAVFDIAKVTVNGKVAGTLWTAPYSIDVTSLLKEGTNIIEIAVTDRAVNRLIGDEQLPEDIAYDKGKKFDVFPEWYNDSAKIAARKRSTFTILKSFEKDSPLVEAGLQGPVTISFLCRVP